MNIAHARGWMPHQTLHRSRPCVAFVLCTFPIPTIPMLPGVAKHAAQYQLVELLRSVGAENGIIELAWSELTLEHQAERMLGILLGQPAVTSMQLDATIYGQIQVIVVSPEHFHRNMSLPSAPNTVADRRSRVDINAPLGRVGNMTEQAVAVGHHRHGWNSRQTLPNLLGQLGIRSHFGVHLIISLSRPPNIGKLAPCVGVAFGIVRLPQHIVEEQISGCGNRRQASFTFESRRPKNSVAFHAKHPLIKRAQEGWLTAVERISNRQAAFLPIALLGN